MTYQEIWEWIYENMNVNQYWSAEDLLYDVEKTFNKTNSYFPPEARDLVKERFQYRREYQEMEDRQKEQKQIADFIGSGKVIESMSDEILDDLRQPEIMGVDISEYATHKEVVVPPEIKKFYQTKETFFGRIAGRFKRLFRR